MAVLGVASVMMAGTVMAQDSQASFDRGIRQDPAESLVSELSMEPHLVVGADTQITGLLADCIQPEQTATIMLNPPVSLRTEEGPLPSQLPIVAPRPINANNSSGFEPDFVVFRLSFP
jgi:hypothetical protein